MALLEIKWSPSSKDLRSFAGMWVVFFGLFGAALRWWPWESPRLGLVLLIMAPIGLIGLARPGFMLPIYKLWMTLAFPIGWTVSHVMMAVVYYIVMTPIGLIMRAVGYDPMCRRIEKQAATYWVKHDPAASRARYFRQF